LMNEGRKGGTIRGDNQSTNQDTISWKFAKGFTGSGCHLQWGVRETTTGIGCKGQVGQFFLQESGRRNGTDPSDAQGRDGVQKKVFREGEDKEIP